MEKNDDVRKGLGGIATNPDYPDVLWYNRTPVGSLVIWEADPWLETTLSWKESCYIHAGISGAKIVFEGPDAQKLLSRAAINDVYSWRIGFGKHLVMLDERGLIASHGYVNREADDRFALYAASPMSLVKLIKAEAFDVKMDMKNFFVYQCAGPKSLTALERTVQEDLHDLAVLETRAARIPGIDAELEVARIGMAGTLSYELRGPGEAGPEAYDALYQAGKAFGMKRLGWRSYTVNHVEAGYPQVTATFSRSIDFEDPSAASRIVMTGSADPSDIRARLRTPVEVGWAWMARFDHDFVGRDALADEMADPKRTIVNLEWNVEDILDIQASYYHDGEPYKFMEYPCGQMMPAGTHADNVLGPDGTRIGISSGTTYSYYYRTTISQCIIDRDFAEIGTDVIVQWGDYGHRIKNVRAKVARYPYLDLPRNEGYDVDSVEHGWPIG